MKIAIVIPNATMSEAAQAERRAFLEANAPADVSFEIWRNDQGPASIESEAERDWAGREILAQLNSRDLSGVDAAVPWCTVDPGLAALRQELTVPVVGPLYAGCTAAQLAGERFSVLMPAGSRKLNRLRVEGYGFGNRLVSIRQINTPVLELRLDQVSLLTRLHQEVDAAAVEGADSVVLGCMALFGMAAKVNASIPVIDPALAAINMAQAMVRLGLRNHIRG